MCEPASMLVTRKRVLWSARTDSHTEMREEFSIREEQPGLPVQAVAVEITPPDHDFNAPLDKWTFRVDQDILPEWWDAEDAETKVRKKLPEWVAERVVLRGQEREVTDGRIIVADGGSVIAWGSSSVEAWDSSRVEARGSARVVAWDSASVVAWDSASVEAWGSARVEARGSSIVVAWGSSSVIARDSATIHARNTQDLSKVLQSYNAVLIDRTQSPPVCYVGTQEAVDA